MIEKFVANNYRRTLVLTRLLLIATCTFSAMYTAESFYSYISLVFRDVLVPRNILFYLMYGIISWAVLEIFVRIVVSVAINQARIFTLPARETTMILLMLFVPRNFVLGVFRLSYYFSPVIAYWGNMFFEFIVSLPFAIIFWKIIRKNYLSSSNAPYVFNVCAVIFCGYFLLQAFMGA